MSHNDVLFLQLVDELGIEKIGKDNHKKKVAWNKLTELYNKAIGGKFDKEKLQEHRIYLNRKEYLAEKKKLYRKNKKALGQQQNSEPPQGIFIISNSNIIE